LASAREAARGEAPLCRSRLSRPHDSNDRLSHDVASDRDRLRLRFSDESLPWGPLKTRLAPMATIAEVEKLALDLPETERAVLAAHLLGSLPSVLHDEDEGIAEALRRDAEFEANPSHGMTLEELDQRIESRRS
jgi:putative addiction module component (TIGR02574 family)